MKVWDTRAAAVGIRPVTRGRATPQRRAARIANGFSATRAVAFR
jgi:hypothetical protein